MNSTSLYRLLIGGTVAFCLVAAIIVAFVTIDLSPQSTSDPNLSIEPTESAAPADPTSSPITGGNSTNQAWLVIVTLVACLTALIAVAVSFYLYRWRKILLAGHPNALVPEEWGAALRDMNKSTNDLIVNSNENTRLLSGHLEHHSGSIQKMVETFMTFKQSLDEKDAEIDRLRRGYDSHIYRRFLQRFIRVHQSLVEYGAEGELSASDARNLALLLEDALEESGVAPFEPDIGEDFRQLGDRIADNPKLQETDDPAAHLTIAAINLPGYEIISGEQPVVLIPAQVTVYRSSKVEEEA